MSDEEGVWAVVELQSRSWRPTRCLIKFERGYCFIVDPGKSITDIKPKTVERVDLMTLIIPTGFWHYGKVSMKFDSSTDADWIEEEMRKLISIRT